MSRSALRCLCLSLAHRLALTRKLPALRAQLVLPLERRLPTSTQTETTLTWRYAIAINHFSLCAPHCPPAHIPWFFGLHPCVICYSDFRLSACIEQVEGEEEREPLPPPPPEEEPVPELPRR